MSQQLISAGAEAALGLISGDLKSSINLLLQIAYSVRHCRNKCTALADKVQMMHSALCRVLEDQKTIHTNRFQEPYLVDNLSKTLTVVQDCIDLVKRYKGMMFVPKLFMSCFIEDDFTAMDERLEMCLRAFNLSLTVQIGVSGYEHRDEIQQEMRQQAQKQKEDIEALKKQVEVYFLETRKLLAGEQQPEDSAVAGLVTLGEALMGGYMISGNLQNTTQGKSINLSVILVQCQEVKEEVAVLKRLSHHESILHFHGTYLKDGQSYLVLERPSTQILTLDDLIANRSSDFINNWRLKRQIALEVAMSLKYAHLAGVLHKNLRSPNIFLTDDLHPKVFGFFQGRIKSEPSAKKWMRMEQIRWAAPEQLPKNRPEFTEQCDIFSLGVVIWELITDSYPFSNFNSLLKLVPYRIREHEGAAALDFDNALKNGELGKFCGISLDCMNSEASIRPNLENIIKRLSMLTPEEMSCNATATQL